MTPPNMSSVSRNATIDTVCSTIINKNTYIPLRPSRDGESCEERAEGDENGQHGAVTQMIRSMYQRTASRQLLTSRGSSSQTALPNCSRLEIIRR